ncbi:hypothetical protein SKAU_G00094200 [Synaphobranchus kaupii]|uniref:SGNH hydrolase-type esterase domain-containing protein n=1 Tax=Synaphobranchus kaupii TaxID=118154 RepID=A0A9Q1J5Q3_SYNKA|nr:hypothetical protein SKAU_G00094200 [Synaphobranchus kaupii]
MCFRYASYQKRGSQKSEALLFTAAWTLPTPTLFPLSISDNKIIISGPIPTHRRRIERWSRLFALHTLSKDYCAATGIPYLNNFDLFWARPILLKLDGLHPNRRGSQMLSENIDSGLSE